MGRPLNWCRTVCVAAVAAVAVGGCAEDAPKTRPTYPQLPARDVPGYLKDSVYEVADMSGTEPFPVSGYGLVANLHGTGGGVAPTPVRDFMAKELARPHGNTGGTFQSPDKILDSKSFAIVKVEGSVPPGARLGHNRRGEEVSTWFDVKVSCLPEGDATSLAHGDLYECDLKVGGANPSDPGNGKVDVEGQAAGALFVNPKYVLDAADESPAAKASRRSGVVLGGARAMRDRPLVLRLRAPQQRLARAVERRINERFQDVADDDLQPHGNSAAKKVANAQDEAVLYVYVPLAYGEHWDHFAGIVRHLYLRGGDPAFAALKARQLADEANTDPKAPLLDISYAWEGLGKPALYAINSLLTDKRPDVRFAAARAAAFIGDAGAVPVLLDIAQTSGDPFRVNAVETLGELPASPRIDGLCRSLLDSDQATVRIAAYQLLVRHRDPAILTRWVKEGEKEIFALDVVLSGRRTGPDGTALPGGGPLVYASQRGMPRIAVFGTRTALDLPMIFTALDNRLMITTADDGNRVTVTYRSPYRKELVEFQSAPSLPALVQAMGGDGGNDGPAGSRLHLGYGDVVAILQALVDEHKVSGPLADGRPVPATFVLGDPAIPNVVPVDVGNVVRPEARPANAAGRPVSNAGDPAAPGDSLIRGPRVDAGPRPGAADAATR